REGRELWDPATQRGGRKVGACRDHRRSPDAAGKSAAGSAAGVPGGGGERGGGGGTEWRGERGPLARDSRDADPYARKRTRQLVAFARVEAWKKCTSAPGGSCWSWTISRISARPCSTFLQRLGSG